MLQASLEFDLIMILSVWSKWYRYELDGNDETPTILRWCDVEQGDNLSWTNIEATYV